MKAWLGLARCGFLMLLAGGTLVFGGSAISGYQTLNEKARLYTFVAWPVGAKDPIHFKSSLYHTESFSFVRIDEGGLFPAKDDTPVRRTTDFDSLRIFELSPAHSVNAPQGPAYVRDSVWYPARVVGKFWVFQRVSGPVTLFTLQPGRGSYRGMDTGSGLQPYSEAAVRAKIATNPKAARLLRQEKIGHTAAWAMGLGGVGLAAVGTITNLASEGTVGNPFVFVGLGLAAVSWIPHLVVADRLDAAIRVYNQEPAIAPTGTVPTP